VVADGVVAGGGAQVGAADVPSGVGAVQDAWSGAGPSGIAIEVLGASIISIACRTPTPTITQIHRCARRFDMHVLMLILLGPPKSQLVPTSGRR
jgi:hypothetical protein